VGTLESSTSPRVLLDVTDLVEFCQRRESVSGVQRVVAEVAPLLAKECGGTCVVLDRRRGCFVSLNVSEHHDLIDQGVRAGFTTDPLFLAETATATMERARSATPIEINQETVLVFLGALWISDALMMAARSAHLSGARIVSLLYDLTPVLETGHTAAVNSLFERYLQLLLDTASRVPAISKSSRRDFEDYAHHHDSGAPAGAATGLPCGLTPSDSRSETSPWPRPYALFVGTIESRKNHLLALDAWQRLIARHGADEIPDLVCIGRLGWNAGDFLRRFVFSKGLDGKVSVLSGSLADGELAAFYEHADFTIYPSRYEGWGLPVAESLAFGKVPVVADNSSLREAGTDLAVYFRSDDVDSFVTALESNVLDAKRHRELQDLIRMRWDESTSWSDVAGLIRDEVVAAQRRNPVDSIIELGREYMFAVAAPPPDEGYGDQYLEYLTSEALTPMFAQPRGERDFEIVDAAVVGTFGSPQAWGNELRPGCFAEFRFTRPVDGPLVVMVSTRSMAGRVSIEASGPGGPLMEDVYLGSVITLPVGDGREGNAALVRLSVTDAQDSIEGFLGIRSFAVLRADDAEQRIIALESANKALRQELDFIQGTRSWKVTAPLRKWKGRES